MCAGSGAGGHVYNLTSVTNLWRRSRAARTAIIDAARVSLKESMLEIFRLFLDIVLWRRGPQDVPRSHLVLAIAVLAYVAVSAVQLAITNEDQTRYVAGLIVEPLLIGGWIWLVLAIFGRRARFGQTLAAIFGAYALLSLLIVFLLLVQKSFVMSDESLSTAALGWLIVFVLVTGRIVMVAVDRGLLTGVAVMVTYIFFSHAVTSALIPQAAV
jgi:hypothetical protein